MNKRLITSYHTVRSVVRDSPKFLTPVYNSFVHLDFPKQLSSATQHYGQADDEDEGEDKEADNVHIS